MSVERLMSNVAHGPGGCWLWTRAPDSEGYGRIMVEGKRWKAHRLAYALFFGEIPDGLQLDHTCRVRHCVNPEHLQPVSQRTNILRGENPAAQNARKTHCPKGHAYDDANTYVAAGRKRYCRECGRERTREYMRKARAAGRYK